jgi:hypothetical protein
MSKEQDPSHCQSAGRGIADLRTGWHLRREPPHYSPPRPKQQVGRACRPASSTWLSLVPLVDRRGGA